MSVPATSFPDTWKKPPFIRSPVLRWSIYIGVVLYLAAAIGTMDINWQRAWDGLPRGGEFIASFFPPSIIDSNGVNVTKTIIDGIMESIWMAILATIAGIVLSVPVGLGAAKNLAPAPVYLFCRSIIATSRSFPEIILAIFAVKLFGFGSFAGLVALSISTVGFFGKLLAEDIEITAKSPNEAVKATGAGWFQWVNYAIQPQVLPRMIGLSVYRLDINFRESAVVGIVGGGGIGATLKTSFERYDFSISATILVTIIAIVMMLEYSSGYLRKWVQ
jgi:phosphonate transport system permease protein